jgi:hypothetical protein
VGKCTLINPYLLNTCRYIKSKRKVYPTTPFRTVLLLTKFSAVFLLLILFLFSISILLVSLQKKNINNAKVRLELNSWSVICSPWYVHNWLFNAYFENKFKWTPPRQLHRYSPFLHFLTCRSNVGPSSRIVIMNELFWYSFLNPPHLISFHIFPYLFTLILFCVPIFLLWYLFY